MSSLNFNNSDLKFFKVDSSTTSVLLCDETARRVSLSVYNNSTADLYISLSSETSLDNFTVKLPSEALYELPYPCYTGKVYGMWSNDNGFATITEVLDK